jgi:periplasmic protein CpxP/Spy
MKQLTLAMVLLIFAGSTSLMAQGGGGRRTIEERIKTVHQKIDSAFKLEATKLTQVDSLFANYYRANDKMRDEMTSANGGERPDFQQMREKMQPTMDARDKELKLILGDDNFKKWKDEIEPTLRRGGGGNR